MSPQVQQSINDIIDPARLGDLKRLELRSKRRIDADIAGAYRSAFRGSGLVFSELREYQPGDEIRHIHWKASARTGRVYVKSYQEDRQLNLMLVVDTSRSTLFGQERSKHQKALEFAALVSMLASQNNDALGLALFSDKVTEMIKPSSRATQVHRVLSSLMAISDLKTRTDIAAAAADLNIHLRRRSVIFLISDFFSTPFEEQLRTLAQRHDLIAVFLEDILDYNPPQAGLVEFEASEGRGRIVIDTSDRSVREQLRQSHEARFLALKQLVERVGGDVIRVDRDPLSPLVSLMRRRMRRYR